MSVAYLTGGNSDSEDQDLLGVSYSRPLSALQISDEPLTQVGPVAQKRRLRTRKRQLSVSI